MKRWGPAGWYPGAPCAGCQGLADIQLVYGNHFPSVWEYAEAVRADAFDVCAYGGAVCPICGRSCGYRPIPAYRRGVIELFPVYRKGRFRSPAPSAARPGGPFPCCPISWPPITAIPWTRWSSPWWWPGGSAMGRASRAWRRPSMSCRRTVTSPLAVAVLGADARPGLRGAHPVLCGWHDLSGMRSGSRPVDQLREVAQYLGALGVRGRRGSRARRAPAALWRPGRRFLIARPRRTDGPAWPPEGLPGRGSRVARPVEPEIRGRSGGVLCCVADRRRNRRLGARC